jgi:hypothetical protein
MKIQFTSNLLVIVSVILASFVFSGCDKDKEEKKEITTEQLSALLKQGTWEITYYFDQEDETSDYTSYTFFFKDGVVDVISPSQALTGSWSISRNDNTSKLMLNFATQTLLDELTDDWEIFEYSDVRMKLRDQSGGNNEIDYLTFDKI